MKDIYKNFPSMKRYAIILGFILFVGAGFFGTVQGQLSQTVADAIGDITSSNDIKQGMWFRYDSYLNGGIRTSWNMTGGMPHIIVNCTGITTAAGTKDPAYSKENPSNTAFNWSVTPYWQNGQKANNLLNGNTTNDAWTYLLKPIRDGSELKKIIGSVEIMRMFIFTDITPWSYTTVQSASEPFFSQAKSWIAQLGGMLDPTSFRSISSSFVVPNSNNTHYISTTAVWDADTNLLYFTFTTEVIMSGSTGYSNGVAYTYLSDCSNDVNLFNKPPVLSPTPFVIVPVTGQSYKYALNINQGFFSKALITIKSNDTTAINDIVNATTTTNMYPLDNVKPAKVNVTVIISVNGKISKPNTITAVLSKFDNAAKLAAVTNASVTIVGDVWNVKWNSTANVDDYRILLNGSTFLTVSPTNGSVQMVEIQPPAGRWSLSIVADLAIGNSTNATAPIVNEYVITESEPSNIGVDTESTGISPSAGPPVTLWIIGGVAVAGIAIVAILVFYFMRIGKIPTPSIGGSKAKSTSLTNGKKTQPMS